MSMCSKNENSKELGKFEETAIDSLSLITVTHTHILHTEPEGKKTCYTSYCH